MRKRLTIAGAGRFFTRCKRLAVFAGICGTLLFLCAGCAKTVQPVQPATPEQVAGTVGKGFTTTADIAYNGIQMRAELSREGDGKCLVTIQSPESLKDLVCLYEDGNVTLTYRGLTASIDPGSFAGKAIVQGIVKVVNMAANPQGIRVETADDKLTVTSLDEQMDFTLTLDRINGNFLELLVPEEDLHIRFDNFTFL